MYKMRKKNQRLYLLSAVVLLFFASPSFASSFVGDLIEGRKLLVPLFGIGGFLMTVVFLATARKGGKSKEVEAYEAELEKFRQSIRR